MFDSNEKHTGKRRKERQITDSDTESVASEGAANPETDATAPETDTQQSETMSRVDRRKKRKKDNLGLNILIGFLVIVLIGGLGLIAYPSVADWWNRMHQSYAVAGYVAKTNDMSKAEKKKLLDAAHAYNLKLAATSDRWHMNDEQKHEYNETLDVTGTGIMGYVTIPRIKVKLPVYHGTSDGVLQIAARTFGRHIAARRRSDHARGGLRTHRPAVRPVADRLGRAAKRRHVRIPRARRNLHVPSGPDLSGAAERNQQAEY